MKTPENNQKKRIVFREGRTIDLCILNHERHFEKCLKFINNQPITRYMLVGNFPIHFNQEEKWFDGLGKDDKNIVFAVETKAGKYLGNGGLHKIDYISRNAEIGLFIGCPNEQGKGYGTEAERLIANYAFSIGLKKVYGSIFSDNIASLKAAEKNGCEIEGKLKKHIFKNGQWHDVVLIAFIMQ